MSPRMGLDMNTILLAAAEIADTLGVEEVTLALLAKRLNVRTPSLYNHIDGLQGLKQKLTLYGLKIMRENLSDATIGKSGDDAVHALSEAYLSFARKHPGLYAITLNISNYNDGKLQKAASDILDIILKVLDAFNLNGDAAIHATRGLRSILHGFSSLEQNNSFGLSQKVDESLHLSINALIAAFHRGYIS